MHGETGNTGNIGRNLGNISFDNVRAAVMRGYDAAHPSGPLFNALPPQKQTAIVDQLIDHFHAGGGKGNLADTPKGVSPEIKNLEPYVLSELRKVDGWDENLFAAGFKTTGAQTKDVGTEAPAR